MAKYIAVALWLIFGFIVLIGMINEGIDEIEDLKRWYRERIDNE